MLKYFLFTILLISVIAVQLTSEMVYRPLPVKSPEFLSGDTAFVDSLILTMTLDEKIGQLIMIGSYYDDEKQIKASRQAIEKYHIGGLIFFKGQPAKQFRLTKEYQDLSTIPLFIAMDAEWGAAMRLDSIDPFPYQMQMGALQDNRLIYESGRLIARELKALGVHINFAPDADVNVNPLNPVINHRSFGEDVDNVAQKAYAYMLGMQENRILAVAKHFPGHGNTSSDSHYQLPLVDDSRETLYSRELVPFQYLINQGVAGVMTAHLAVPAFDSCAFCPSSLSPVLIDTVLKQELGFRGLIFTDALNMGGAKNDDVKPAEIAIRALLAGNDVLLMPTELKQTIKGIKKAVKTGRLDVQLIEEKCRKILLAKQWAGLFKQQFNEQLPEKERLNSVEKKVLIEKIIEQSITLPHNPAGLIPFARLDTLHPVLLDLSTDGKAFNNRIMDYLEMPVVPVSIRDTGRFGEFYSRLDTFNLVIANLTCGSQFAKRDFGIGQPLINFLEEVAIRQTVVLVINGNPYVLNRFTAPKRFAAILCSYDQKESNQDLAAQALFAARSIKGRLPVGVNGFDLFSGEMCYAENRLGFSFPEAVHLRSDSLQIIDSIVFDAIEQKAMPGCQVLVARNGKVVFEKAYGTEQYTQSLPVRLNQLYDLASLTKILATLPWLMKLTEEGVIDLQKTIADYLPQWDTCKLASAKLLDILVHQAGLPAWIPFYLATIESDSTRSLFYRSKPEPGFTTEVTHGLYIMDTYADSIYARIAAVELDESPEYKYSDLGFYLFQQIIEKKMKAPLEDLCTDQIYTRLGNGRMLFNPLTRFSSSEIIPTEDDREFRRQLLRGYVHDPGAAMLGGVCGHAGLFADALNVARMMQLYLNEGIYGDFRFLEAETIRFFTSAPYESKGNRRGVGFDKPEMDYSKPGPCFHGISGRSFGHSGFTGTLAWADPESGILFVFLSNRVCPDAKNSKLVTMNVRTKIHEQIYKARY